MQAGDVVSDRFELERLAGHGGMATVFRARDRVTGGLVAVKVASGAGCRSLDRLEQEAQLLAELEHPGIVRYVAQGRTDDGERYLVMDWLEGEDLAARLARGPLSIPEALELAAQVADALAHAHARGVIHRDLKPSNLFLVGGAPSGVRVLDFGVARVEGREGLTRPGVVVGTLAYMAPEQARGGAPGAQADVFALGAVLFECLAGRRAVVAGDVCALLVKLLLEEPPRLSEVLPGAPPALEALVASLLAKAPEDRPRDGAAARAALRRLGAAGEGDAGGLAALARPALSPGERRWVGLVVVAPSATREGCAWATENAVAARLGARLEPLADGTLLAILTGEGLPQDQAARACRVALALRAAAPQAAIAVASGRGDAGVRVPVGEVAERAARELRRAVAQGSPTIALDDVTAGLLDTRFEVDATSAGPTLEGESDAPRSVRRLVGRSAPFLGRERELTTLVALWEDVVSEPIARAAVVLGPAGAGKSRLRQELLRQISAREGSTQAPAVWHGASDPMTEGSAFCLLAQAVRGAAGLREGEASATQQARIRALAQRLVPESDRARVAEFGAELVGAPLEGDASPSLLSARADARLMGDQLRQAFQDLLRGACAEGPVLLVLEDVHWGDRSSIETVDLALRNLGSLPWMVLALARPEVRDRFPSLWGGRTSQELRLAPLTKRGSARLVQALLGERTPDETVSAIVERAEGNAFALEELVHASREGRREIPDTVLALTQARLDALDPEARRVLRAASVFGRTFSVAGVEALVGETTVPLGRLLEGLVARDVLVPMEALGPRGVTFGFRHALLREAAYAMLTAPDRELGHRLAARWLEAAGEHDASVLGGHLERGGEPQAASAWWKRAAMQQLVGDDLTGALERIERALACGAAGRERVELLLCRAEAEFWRADYPSSARAAAEAFAEAEPGSELAWEAGARIAEVALRNGRPDDTLRVAAQLSAVPAALACGATVASLRVALTLYMLGEARAAEALLAALRAPSEPPPQERARYAAWRELVSSYAAVDPYRMATHQLAAAEHFARLGDRRHVVRFQANAANALRELGAYEAAADLLRVVSRDAGELGLAGIQALARQTLAMVLASLGQLEEGLSLAEESLAAFSRLGDARLELGSSNYVAHIRLLRGEVAEAERLAAEVAERSAPFPFELPYALMLVARARLARGDAAGALPAAEQALDLVRARGLDEGESLVRLTVVEARLAVGDRAGAARASREACERLRDRAALIDDEALRSGFLERVAENARTLALAEELLGP